MLAPSVGVVPCAVGANEFGPSWVIDFSVGGEGVVVGVSDDFELHDEIKPMAAMAHVAMAAATGLMNPDCLVMCAPDLLRLEKD